MIKYQVFNPALGQYSECETIDNAKSVRTNIQNEYLVFQNIGEKFKTEEIISYDEEKLRTTGITKEMYDSKPLYVYIPYSDCNESQKTQLDNEKNTFIQNNQNLFVVNQVTIDENNNATWSVIDTSNW
jgi:hypothetical protein